MGRQPDKTRTNTQHKMERCTHCNCKTHECRMYYMPCGENLCKTCMEDKHKECEECFPHECEGCGTEENVVKRCIGGSDEGNAYDYWCKTCLLDEEDGWYEDEGDCDLCDYKGPLFKKGLIFSGGEMLCGKCKDLIDEDDTNIDEL